MAPSNTAEREWSLKQVADRVADTITAWGLKDGYFVDDEEAQIFNHELKHLIIHQKAAFNSPVWFNIGVPGVPQQGSACQPFTRSSAPRMARCRSGDWSRRMQSVERYLTQMGLRASWPSSTTVRSQSCGYIQKRVTNSTSRVITSSGGRATNDMESSSLQRTFVPTTSSSGTAGNLSVRREIVRQEIAEAALAGWLQSDGFVGQYTGNEPFAND